MNDIKIRLRKLASENNDDGSPEARDNVIDMFLSDLSQLVSEDIIRKTEDTNLRALYVMWLNNSSRNEWQEEERIKYLTPSVVILPGFCLADKEPEEDQPLVEGNVVTLIR